MFPVLDLSSILIPRIDSHENLVERGFRVILKLSPFNLPLSFFKVHSQRIGSPILQPVLDGTHTMRRGDCKEAL